MNTKNVFLASSRKFSLACSSIAALLLAGFPLLAQTTWQGTTSNWGTSSNWSPSSIPNTEGTKVFIYGPATTAFTLNTTTSRVVGGLEFLGSNTQSFNITLGGDGSASARNIRIYSGTMSSAGDIIVQPGASGTISIQASDLTGPRQITWGPSSGASGVENHSVLSSSTSALLVIGVEQNQNTTSNATTLNLTYGGAGNINVTAPINVTSAANRTVNLIKQDSGILTLTSTNGYNGATTISGGVLQLGNGGTTGSLDGTTAITNNATLAINRSDAPVISLGITGSGGLAQVGTGTTILTGANSFTGTTTISSGAVQIGSGGGSGSLASDVSIQNSGALIFARTGTLTYAGVISGSTGLIQKQNSGTLTLTGASTFGGTTSITAGNIMLGNTNALQNSTISVGTTNGLRFATGTNSYTIGALSGGSNFSLQDTDSSAVVLRAGNNNASTTYSGDLSGAGSLVKIGTGTLTLTGSNTFSGAATVTNGALQIGQGGTVGSISSDIDIQNNAALIFAKTGTMTYGGVISGTSGLFQKLNSGTLILTGASTFSGTTLVQSTANNNIRLANTNALQNSTVSVSVTNGLQFDTGTNAYTIGALSGGSNFALQDIAGSAVTLRAGNNNTSSTYSGVMSGTGALLKVGTGTLTLSGGNSYSGDTTVSAGTLLLSGAGSMGTGNVVVNGTLDITGIAAGTYELTATQTLGGAGTILASGKTLSVAGTLAPGNSPGTLTVDGAFTLENTAVSNFEIGGVGAGEFDQLIVSGLLTLDGTLNLSTAFSASLGQSVNLFDWGTLSGTFDNITGTDLGGGLFWDTSTLYTNGTITVVPEPATAQILTLTVGLMALLQFRRRKLS